MSSIKQKINSLLISIRYVTFRKINNIFKLYLTYLFSDYSKIEKHKLLPAYISIEAANFCNLHCPECPVGNGTTTKSNPATFDISLYKNIITELKSTLLHVILYFQGEPFLHPALLELIQFAHSSSIYCSTSTNGQFITKNNASKIVLSGIDKIIISIDGTTQDTYETYRIGGSLNKALNGIKELVRAKEALHSATPIISIQFLVLKSNEHQMRDMKQLAKSLRVDNLIFKTAQLYDFENGNKLMPSKAKFSRYKKNKSGTYKIKGQQPNRCWRMWSGAVVNVNGEILPCCFDKNSEHFYGNLQNKLFAETWHNKKASNFRESILQNRKQYEMCRNCTSH